MIQVLALRAHGSPVDGQERKSEVWFEKGIRSPTVEDLFLDPEATLSQIEPSERFNVYYTIAECEERTGRIFSRQYHIPFDVDGIEVPDDEKAIPRLLEPLARVVCAAIGCEYDETAILFSGNGLQFIVGIKDPIEDVEYFDKARGHYRAICDRIDLRLSEHKIEGKADPSVWSRARLMRHPLTQNRKPGKPARWGQILQPNIMRGTFSLEEASGLPTVDVHDQIAPQVARSLFTPDPDEIMSERGCSFLTWAKATPKEVTEPLWYAALSIVGLFPNGRQMAHEISKGHPKYSQAETELKLKQSLDRSGPRTCKNIQALWGKCQTCPNYQKYTSPIAIVGEKHIKTINSGFYTMGVDKEGRPRKGKPAYFDLLKFFQRQHDFVSVVNSPDLYTWNGSHWNRRFKDEITGFAQDHFDPKPDDKMRQEFYKHVKHENRVQNDWFEGRTRGLFNFANGVYDVAEGVLKPHFKESGFKFTLPCEFTPSAEAPQFRQFMRNITLDRLELELVLQEFMGYILSGMEPIHAKALALLGTGANGKSTFVNVLRDLIGKDGYSSLSLKDMQNDQARYLLANKIANFAEENSRDSFKDTELVKNFISGGEIRAKQLYAQPFEFKNNSKLIINMNELPTNYDRTQGFFRRLLIVPFDANFLDKPDKHINKKLRSELPGIFNYAIEGYKRLMEQGQFTDSQIVIDALENYSTESSEVKSWLLDEVSYEPLARLTMQKQQIYNSYREYCEKTGVKWPLAMNEFFKQLKFAMESLRMEYSEVRVSSGGVRLRELAHIKLREGGMHLVVNYAPGQIKAEVKET